MEDFVSFTYILTGTLAAPKGSKLNETGSGIILPDGRELKLWETPELREGENYRDLPDAGEVGVFYDGDVCRFEED